MKIDGCVFESQLLSGCASIYERDADWSGLYGLPLQLEPIFYSESPPVE